MPEWWNLILLVLKDSLVLTTMLVGLFTLAIPILPGLVIIWVAGLGYGLLSGFGTVGWIMFTIMTVLMIFGSVIDNIIMGTQAHKEGASCLSVIVAFIAAIVGNYLLPILGGIIAALLTLFIAEWIRQKKWRKALITIKGMVIGYGWAFVIRFIIGLIMIGLWMIWAWA